MNNSEVNTITSFHVAFRNLRVMATNERPVEVDVAFIGGLCDNLKIEISSNDEKNMLVVMDVKYVDGSLMFFSKVLARTDPKMLSAMAYATRFAERVYNLVKIHPDYVTNL